MAKNRHVGQMKLNIPMCLACVLLCLTLISIHMTSGLYAKYTVSSDGSDAARVARFEVSENGAYFSEDFMIQVTPGMVEKTVEVINESEVALNCVITIENKTDNIPYVFSVNGTKVTEGSPEVTYSLEPNSGANLIPIQAYWNPKGALDYMGMVDLITITLYAEQAD